MPPKREAARGEEERNKLAEENMDLAAWVVTKFFHPYQIQLLGGLEDAKQIAYQGLVRCAEVYEKDKGKFSTFATRWLRFYLCNYVAAASDKKPHKTFTDHSLTKEHQLGTGRHRSTRIPAHFEVEDLRDGLALLAKKDRDSLVDYYGLNGVRPMTLKAIATKEGVSLEAIRTRVLRARQHLRRAMERLRLTS